MAEATGGGELEDRRRDPEDPSPRRRERRRARARRARSGSLHPALRARGRPSTSRACSRPPGVGSPPPSRAARSGRSRSPDREPRPISSTDSTTRELRVAFDPAAKIDVGRNRQEAIPGRGVQDDPRVGREHLEALEAQRSRRLSPSTSSGTAADPQRCHRPAGPAPRRGLRARSKPAPRSRAPMHRWRTAEAGTRSSNENGGEDPAARRDHHGVPPEATISDLPTPVKAPAHSSHGLTASPGAAKKCGCPLCRRISVSCRRSCPTSRRVRWSSCRCRSNAPPPTARGPGTVRPALLRASQSMELYDDELGCEPCEIGIATAPPFHPEAFDMEEAMAELDAECHRWMEAGKFLVTLGGEHSLTIAPVRAAQRVFGGRRDRHRPVRRPRRPARGVRGHALLPRQRHAAGLRRGDPLAPGRHPLAVGARGRAHRAAQDPGSLGPRARTGRGAREALRHPAEDACRRRSTSPSTSTTSTRRSFRPPARPSPAAAAGTRPCACCASSSRPRMSWRWTSSSWRRSAASRPPTSSPRSSPTSASATSTATGGRNARHAPQALTAAASRPSARQLTSGSRTKRSSADERYPTRTLPPLTLTISPVRCRARAARRGRGSDRRHLRRRPPGRAECRPRSRRAARSPAPRRHLGVDPAGRDGVDPDIGSELHRPRLGRRDHGALRRRIRAVERLAALAGGRGDVDHARLLRQAQERQRLAHAVEGAADVDAHGLDVAVLAELRESDCAARRRHCSPGSRASPTRSRRTGRARRSRPAAGSRTGKRRCSWSEIE